MANPRITELRDAEREETARRRRKVQKTAAIVAACTVGVVGIAFAGLLVNAHLTDQRQASKITIVKVKTVPIVAEVAAAEPTDKAKAVVADANATDVAITTKADAVTMADAVDDLEATDPRWARNSAGAVVIKDTTNAAGSALTALAPVEPSKAEAAIVDEEKSDGVETAAIAPDEVKPKPVDKKPVRSATSDEAPQRMASVSSDVRLRAGRSSGSAVLGVIPRGTEVGVVSCEGWCEVVYAGKRGFIYKNYVAGSKLTIVRKNSDDDQEPQSLEPSGTQATAGQAPANRNLLELGR